MFVCTFETTEAAEAEDPQEYKISHPPKAIDAQLIQKLTFALLCAFALYECGDFMIRGLKKSYLL